MKVVQIILILCLLASFNCDLFSFLTCMMANQDVNGSLNTLFDKIKDGEEFYTILLFVASKIGAFADAIKTCNL